MPTRITILVGTMTGTAQLCAQEMELALDDGDTQVEAVLMDGLDSSIFERAGGRGDLFLICTSTYGQGDVPDNARALYEDLQKKRPNLSGVRYGVFGLGDKTYAETFNYGGKRFDDLLTELGARRIGERYRHDASSGVLPEEKAVEWCREWLEAARQGNAAAV
jgi:MioC protein